MTAAERLRVTLTSLKQDGGVALRKLLQEVWPWPVEPDVGLLRELVPLGIQVLPAGQDLTKWVPDPTVADEDRSPQGEAESGPEPFAAWVAEFNAVNRAATEAAQTWVRGGSARKVVICCGLLHYFAGKAAVADDLRRAGLHVVVEVGFIKEIEAGLLARFGAATCSSWFDLGSGLIRCPYPRLEKILAEECFKPR